MDNKQGLVCQLTGEKATFQNECPDFNFDENVKPVTLPIREDQETGIAAESVPADILERLKMEQNLPAAIITGLVIGVAGAILWAIITVSTGFQIGYMAIAIGAGVGYGMRYLGKGIDPIFGFAGAASALFGCLLGNFLSIVGFTAEVEGWSIIETLSYVDYSYIPKIMADTFSPMDLVFYGIALYEGYRFSFRVITNEDLA